MGLIVVDASAAVELLAADDEPRRFAVAARLSSGGALYAPSHFDVEVISALRGIGWRNAVIQRNAPNLLSRLHKMPVRRERLSEAAMGRIWQLRENMTPYDAGYVALAEELGASLVTCDAKFIAPPGIACTIELIR
jgi:predicted nucleic acid-binding protein